MSNIDLIKFGIIFALSYFAVIIGLYFSKLHKPRNSEELIKVILKIVTIIAVPLIIRDIVLLFTNVISKDTVLSLLAAKITVLLILVLSALVYVKFFAPDNLNDILRKEYEKSQNDKK